MLLSKRKVEAARAAERRQHAANQKPRTSNSQSPFLVSSVIPQAAVKPQQINNPKTHEETHVKYEDETTKQNEQNQVRGHSTSPDALSPKRRKKKSRKHHKRQNEHENGHVNETCEENREQMLYKLEQHEAGKVEEEDENQEVYDSECGERQPPTIKERKRKKKRHKRKVESPFSQEDEESDKGENVAERTLESDDISSRLPPPRKLPPLKSNSPINDNEQRTELV